MSIARHHAEWLSLVEVSGPFFSLPVVSRIFNHGLNNLEPGLTTEIRAAYTDWQEHSGTTATHQAWVQYVLQRLLGFNPDLIASGQMLPPGLEARVETFHEILRPDFAILPPPDRENRRPVLLVRVYPPEQRLESPLKGSVWKASPAARMMELLHTTDLPLGLVTNGEEWQLVFAPKNESTGFASWFADLWLQEPITLRAFQSLLSQHRFFGVADAETPSALLYTSLKDQHEVTDSLGAQVRQAVELLVRDFDRLDIESSRALLAGLKEADIYNASLTVMMRLVFLFCAEEKGLLRLGEAFYDTHYAVSTLREQLREIADQRGEEVLERRSDAWCRLLATFRAVHGGVGHDAMRLPTYGGTLFDPDRYPFLEGRALGTQWQNTPSIPPHINNRVVLHLLEALQILRTKLPGGGPVEARRLSFRSLDIEQIGHVYEGLLDHTAHRAKEITLGLEGSSKSPAPIITLTALEAKAAAGNDALLLHLEEITGRSRSALANAIGLQNAKPRGKKKVTAESAPESTPPSSGGIQDSPFQHSLSLACGYDPRLITRVRPFIGLMRQDSFEQLVLILKDSLLIAPSTDRRSTGTHYTPRSLTEPIVKRTLEPLVYTGPAEGLPEAEWKLKTAKEILALKVCDLAVGSGAFLVETCRYLAERLCEAWEISERDYADSIIITPDGELSAGSSAERLLPFDPVERLAIARRYVADRCLYGVDINPMAVEMAKLSLWLITLQKDRPFTFVDHALKCGDSLLGVRSMKQIENFSLRVQSGETLQEAFSTANLFRYVEDAASKRRALEKLPSNDHNQIESKNRLHAEAEAAIAKMKGIADYLVAFELRGLDGKNYDEQRDEEAENVHLLMQRDGDASIQTPNIKSEIALAALKKLGGRPTFHWALEFSEVFACGGFDAFIGNPPFMHGSWISSRFGDEYAWLIRQYNPPIVGKIDYVVFFLRRAANLLCEKGCLGLILTSKASEGDARSQGFQAIRDAGFTIYEGATNIPWPGAANILVCFTHATRQKWSGYSLNSSLESNEEDLLAHELIKNDNKLYVGAWPGSMGFMMLAEEAEAMRSRSKYCQVIRPFYTGADFAEMPTLRPCRYVIDFSQMSLSDAESEFPDLVQHLEKHVKPVRLQSKKKIYRDHWWQFCEPQHNLFTAIRKHKITLAVGRVSKYFTFRFVPTDAVYSDKVVVYDLRSYADFAVLNSELHNQWALLFGATHGAGTPNYKPGTCGRAFPFPFLKNDASQILDVIGERLETHLSSVLNGLGIGPTEAYNRFHSKSEYSEGILKLRELHVEMDNAVATSYGWSDLGLDHGFHPTKQGERYTISESARREILARLLALNHKRYSEELAAALHEKKPVKKAAIKRGRVAKASLPETRVPVIPLGFRFPAPSPQLYAVNLVTALLSFRTNGLAWPLLRDAFAAATRPSLMQRLALPDDKQKVDAWASRWNEQATPDLLIQTLREMSSSNIDVSGSGSAAVFTLQDGGKEPVNEDVAYDAWIALHVIELLAAPAILNDEASRLDAEFDKLLKNIR